MHSARQRLISNKALRAGAIEAHVPPFIQSKSLVPKIWQPCPLDTEDAQQDEVGSKAESGSSTPVPGADAASSGGVVPQKQERQTRPYGGKRKRQRDEHVIQWLGDKVRSISANYRTSFPNVAVDRRRRRRSIYRSGIPHWRT